MKKENSVQGILMPIGGAEDKIRSCHILQRFVELCGDNLAHIVVIPSASSIPYNTAAVYERVFHRLGAGFVSTLHIEGRHQANSAAYIQTLQEATGVFIGGGDQLRLMALMGGTRMADALNQRFHAGMHVAGTSAGASIMSRHMIAFGRSGAAPSQRMVQMASGLGLAPGLIIDQHFSQRNRLGRLLTAVALNPGLTGIGVDEDTALMIMPDGKMQVIGFGTVTVVDSHGLTYNGVYSAKRYDAFTVEGLEIHTLQAVDRVASAS
jgi:cyanophycinase